MKRTYPWVPLPKRLEKKFEYMELALIILVILLSIFIFSGCGSDSSSESVNVESFRAKCIEATTGHEDAVALRSEYDFTAGLSRQYYDACMEANNGFCVTEYATDLLRAVEACGGECDSLLNYECH